MFRQDVQSMLSFFNLCFKSLILRIVHLPFLLDRLSLRRGEFLSALAMFADELYLNWRHSRVTSYRRIETEGHTVQEDHANMKISRGAAGQRL